MACQPGRGGLAPAGPIPRDQTGIEAVDLSYVAAGESTGSPIDCALVIIRWS